ncbi:hypothetical protein L6164_033290 [Bauhinia variegata]|uniref:Uncharacterized protein n=1 Tax=Bauhinia variegata TaxID=167791 RepID=A0ACB9KR92_BAUVA|nr:hypothetical protein L6164_033290 [Bauhinia variegata]
MATNSSNVILNEHEPTYPLVIVSFQNASKLTTTNYLAWKLHVEAILIDYGLYKFLDGTHPALTTIITTEGTSSPNPVYLTWVYQYKLIFGAIVGTLSSTLSPLVSTAKTAKDAYDILAQNFARPSCGHIKQLKD